MSLPSSVLNQHGDQPAVRLFEAQTARLRLAQVRAVEYGQDRVVLTGVQPGASVITAGVHKLDENPRVRVAETKR